MEITTAKNGRKSQIRNEAQNLFREKGYAASSMRELAKVVGIEPASLYSHYSAKGAILLEICADMAAQFFNAIKGIYHEDYPADEKLRQMIIAHINVIWRNMDAATVFFHEWRFLEGDDLMDFKKQRRSYEDYFRDVLEKGIADETFKAVDLKIALPTLFSSMNWTYEWAKKAADKNPDDIGVEIFKLFYAGIKKP